MIAAAWIVLTMFLLALLAWRDPKPQRAQLRGVPIGDSASARAATRRLLAWLSVLPGIVLAVSAQWWAFLIWMGITCATGWILAHLLTLRPTT